jgi:hypothetical protein
VFSSTLAIPVGENMRRTSFWRCSCGTALRSIVELSENNEKEVELAICPVCYELIEIDGGIVELRAIDETAASA